MIHPSKLLGWESKKPLSFHRRRIEAEAFQEGDGESGSGKPGVLSVEEVCSLTSTCSLVHSGSQCFHQCNGHSNTHFHYRSQIQKLQRSFRPWSRNNLSACLFCKWSNRSWWHWGGSPLATQLLKQNWDKGQELLPSLLIFFLPIYTSSRIHCHSWEAENFPLTIWRSGMLTIIWSSELA